MTGSELDDLDDLDVDDPTREDDDWLRQIAHAPVPAPGALMASASGSLLGSVLGDRYELLEEVGRGGMGVVYRALDRRGAEGGEAGDQVAVKVTTTDGQATERFSREVRLLSELRHPGIVAYLDQGHLPGGRPYLVMEWLEGVDLARRLRHGPLALGDAQALLGRAAEALAFAHGRGVVHRDLKPHNLFLRGGEPGDVVVLDFGVARDDEGAAMTRTGMILGTPSYIAPEQITSSRGVGPAADIFSLGCVIYHCLAGAPPFVAQFPDQVLTKIVTQDAPRVRSACPEVPAALDHLVARMLCRDLSGRPADGAALLRELGALAGQGEERP